jgi:hypothetical protein
MMRLFASDFVSAGRRVMSKQQLEDAVRSNFVDHGNGPSPVTIEKKNMAVYLFGDTAVVTYIKEYRQTRDTTKFVDEDITDVFKREAKVGFCSSGNPLLSRTPPQPDLTRVSMLLIVLHLSVSASKLPIGR